MKIMLLQVLFMPNNEILFNGRSLGFLKPEEQKKYLQEEPIKPEDVRKMFFEMREKVMDEDFGLEEACEAILNKHNI